MKYVPLRPGAEPRICERMRLEPDIERRVSGAKQVFLHRQTWPTACELALRGVITPLTLVNGTKSSIH
jgi:hypothetical protein